jgi:hypothetical protein
MARLNAISAIPRESMRAFLELLRDDDRQVARGDMHRDA